MWNLKLNKRNWALLLKGLMVEFSEQNEQNLVLSSKGIELIKIHVKSEINKMIKEGELCKPIIGEEVDEMEELGKEIDYYIDENYNVWI